MTHPIRHSDFTAYIADQSPFAYAYKKAEKLSVALHMVTSFIDRNEPLYVKIRERGLIVLSSILNLRADYEQTLGIERVYDAIMNALMLLDVAYHAGYLSEMNWAILRREYLELGNFIRETKNLFTVSESSLSPSFFHVERPIYDDDSRKITTDVLKSSLVSKRQSIQRVMGKGQFGKRQRVKEHRRNQIVSIVKDKRRASIKDISLLIADCSRKTLQRELISLVEAGLLRREGKRRWSTYSIA